LFEHFASLSRLPASNIADIELINFEEGRLIFSEIISQHIVHPEQRFMNTKCLYETVKSEPQDRRMSNVEGWFRFAQSFIK